MTIETGVCTVTLTFPPGAVSEPVALSFPDTSSLPLPGGQAYLGGPFAMQARTGAGAPVTGFEGPYTMQVEYDEARLGNSMDETSLMLYVWDDDTREWGGVSSEVDVEADSLVASLDQVATFGVLGKMETGAPIYLPFIFKRD